MPNRVRWDGRSRRFYEVWYFIVQRPAERDAVWIRYTLLNPGDDHPEAGAALWFGYVRRGEAASRVAIHRTFPPTALRARPGAFDVAIGDAVLTEGALRGALSADGHEATWDLRYRPSSEVQHYFGPLLRRLMERKTSVTVPNPHAIFEGRVTLDGRELAIAGCPGHEAHHWGREKATGWRWAHVAAFDDAPGSMALALSADRPPLPTMTFLKIADAGVLLDAASLATALRNTCEVSPWTWRFTARTGGRRVELEISADAESILRLTYHSPRYEVSHCYNSPVADARVRIWRPGGSGGSVERELVARATANAEIVVPAGSDERFERAMVPVG